MVRTKLDIRIKMLIENGVNLSHRSMFVIVGDRARDQIPILYHILTKSTVKTRPPVLWCYKSDLGFSSHYKKRMKQIQRKIKTGKVNLSEEDPFQMFIGSTDIRYCYYSETQNILGQTYGVCVLQDFEAITPNVLARTIETVEGGGLVIILLKTMNSLKQLYSMAMDVHEIYRTEAHQDVVGRFNERFLLSLSSCRRSLVVNDKLEVLPLSHHANSISQVAPIQDSTPLDTLKSSLKDTDIINELINCCKTLDQAKAVLKFIDAISEKTLKSTISLTAARGRGKSAAMGLAVAAAIEFGYSNIFVTSPSPDNLKCFFEFVFKGLDALNYQEHIHYGLVESVLQDKTKALTRINVFKQNRQTVQYIHPTDAVKLTHAELLIIDEAAAIPLPFVRKMFGPYLIFLASTINGYEGTGRSLSLKLFQELRPETTTTDLNKQGRALEQITLDESIRYKPGDGIETWLNDLLCLDATIVNTWGQVPLPEQCQLFYINRDTLFCYHKATEAFLHKMVALFVSSHYKNSPNDLQLMSDAPGHHLFCLVGPVAKDKAALPEIYCVIQVCVEGRLSKEHIGSAINKGLKPSGDLIPWTLTNQFQDQDFPLLTGLRVVRIATHPDHQNMGYGTRALTLLQEYYEHKIPFTGEEVKEAKVEESDGDENLLEEKIEPRTNLKPLFTMLNERKAEDIDYIGVAYGITHQLFKFWKRNGFTPVYVRQTPNDITGEHSCIMLKVIGPDTWLKNYWKDFRVRFINLLSFSFRSLPTNLAKNVITTKNVTLEKEPITKQELDLYLNKYDLKRLSFYCNKSGDIYLIMDLLPNIAKLYFSDKLGDLKLTALQAFILLGLGLQHKSAEDVADENDIAHSQLMGLLNRILKKIQTFFETIDEEYVGNDLELSKKMSATDINSSEIMPSLIEEMDKADKKMKRKQSLIKNQQITEAIEDGGSQNKAILDQSIKKSKKHKRHF